MTFHIKQIGIKHVYKETYISSCIIHPKKYISANFFIIKPNGVFLLLAELLGYENCTKMF
jgi:hypothetical protein